MRLDTPLDDIFRNRSHVRVLRTLSQLPEGWPASGREIARRAGVSHPTAATALAALVEQGLVHRTRLVHADSYELRRTHVAAKNLIELFSWESGLRRELVSFLREEIERQVPYSVAAAFLFGSAAAGEMDLTSDIDIGILCARGATEDVETAMGEVEEAVRERFGNRLNVVVSDRSLEDLRKRNAPSVWRSMLAEGIPIIEQGGSDATP